MAEKVIGFKIQIEGLAGTIETATQLKRQIAELNAELKKTADVEEIKKLEKKLVDLKAAQSLVNDVTREQVKLRKEEIAGIDKSEGAYRRLSKELNDQRKRYKDLAAAEQESSQEAKDLIVSINALDKRLKGIDATVGQFQRNVGGYTEALSNFFPKLGGSLGQVTGAIGGLSMGITQLGKTTGAANISLGAIGIALTAFSAISEIFATVNQTVEETRRLSQQVNNFTQASGLTLQSFVAQSKAIATTYSQDVDSIIVAANTASKELGVTFPEALNAIELGFRKGADAQGEFLQSLREYPSQLGQAGFTLKEFTAIAIDSANQGIYSDKAIDAIKEFGTQTREQTKSVKDSFIDALGSDFTNKLFTDLNTNAISGRDALALVTKEIKTTGVSGKELQGLISTVFVGAGEDAGRYVLSLGDVLNNTNEILSSTNKYQTQQKELYESNLDLEESQAALNEMLVKTSGEFTIINNASKTFFNNVLLGLVEMVNQFPATFKAMSIGFQTFFATRNIKVALDANRIVFRNEIDKINKEDEIALKNAEKQRKATEEQLAKDKLERENERRNKEKILSGKGGKDTAQAFVNGSIAKLQEEQSKLQKAFGEAVVGSVTQKEIAVKLNEVNAQIKTAVDAQNEILGKSDEEKKRIAIDEINQNFKVAQSVINLARSKQTTSEDEIENINQRRIILDNDYAREVQRINNLLALEKTGSKEAENLLIERRAAEANYIKGKEGLEKQEKGINDSRLAANKKFNKLIAQGDIDAIKDNEEREIATAKKKLADDLANLENDKDFIIQSELEKAKLRELLVNKSATEIQEIRDNYDKKELETKKANTQELINSISDSILSVTDIISTFQQARAQKEAEAINEQITNTENNIAELEAKAEKASGLRKKRIEKDIEAQKQLLVQQQAEAEAIRLKAAKEDKKIAIIQAIIQGALAVQRALASVPFPANLLAAIPTGIAAAAQIATIVAQPLAEGGVVTGERVNRKQNIPTRSNGDNVLAYVKRGEVVLNQRQQSLLGGSPTFRRIGIKGFADGGLVPPISAPIQAISGNNDLSNFLQVIEAKTDAINNRIDRLQAYVVSDDIARDLAEGNKLKVKATL
jgi:hypothetical protein